MHRVTASWILAAALACATPAAAHEPLHSQIDGLTGEIAAAPDRAGLYLERAELLRLDGQPQRAEADLATAERLRPGEPAIALCRAEMLRDAGRLIAARRALDALLARSPALAPARALSAEVYVALGRTGEAIADLDSAIARSRRRTPELYLELARLLSGRRDLARSLASVEEGVRACGPSPALEDFAVDLEVELGRPDSALARLDSMMALAPRRANLLARRGDILLAAGRELEAWVAYSQGLAEIEALPPYKRRAAATAALEERLRAALRSHPQAPASRTTP